MPKLQLDDGSGTTAAQVAEVSIQFREPGTDRIVTDSVSVNFPLPPWVTPPMGYFDAPDVSIVHKSFVMLNIYAGLEMAANFFAQGNNDETIGILRALRAGVVDYNEEIGDEDIAADLLILDDMILTLVANGVVDPANPPIPENPWPLD